MNKDNLRKAIDTLALNYTEGNVSIDVLEKACRNYKAAIDFNQDFDYDLIVAKSLIDKLNGLPMDDELNKAIIPGQTKVIDGVTYVYSATKQGSKTKYDWHIVTTNQQGKATGRGINLNATQKQQKQQYINDLFPKDISSLKVVKPLSGSTGAQLVEDVDGNQYVMKKAGSGLLTNDMVKNEYLANQLYDMLGVRVPDYELYNEGGTNILLSRFIPGLTGVDQHSSQADRKAMAANAMCDVLMNNWDVFQNDNTNKDAAGRIIRVDNGGSLAMKAQGKPKPFNDDIEKNYNDMVRYNQAIFGELSDDEIIVQIKDIKKRKADVVNYLRLTGEDKLADIFEKRIDNLTKIEKRIYFKKNVGKRKILPRKLKPEKEMYRAFTDDEVQEFFDNAVGNSGTKKVEYKGSQGWDLIHTVCEARGFTARPRVVTETEYWNEISKGKTQLFRGLHDTSGCSIDYQKDDFKYGDDFYVGQQGIYGGGLYATVNDGDKYGGKTDRSKGAYRTSTAFSYASSGYGQSSDESTLLMALEDDVKLIEYNEIKKMLESDPALQVNNKNLKKIGALQNELDGLTKDITKLSDDLLHVGDKVKQQVYSDMHYDEKAVTELYDEIDDLTDWGAVDANGDPDFPKYKEFVEGKIIPWVEANGGEVKREHGQVTLKMPNSPHKFTIMQYQWDMPSIIRRRNSLSPHYHNYAKRFEIWFETNHVSIVKAKVDEEMKTVGDKVTKLKDEISNKQQEASKKQDEIHKLQTGDKEPDKNMYHAIEASLGGWESDCALGLYAVLKGYDGIYIPNGNHSHTGFVSMLNRSKIIVKQ